MEAPAVARPQPSLRRRLSHWLSDRQSRPAAGPEEQTIDKESVRRLKVWTDLASWQQHGSELIHTGYRNLVLREASGSIIDCICSLTYIHNETVNIYSHIFGALIFLAMPLWIFIPEIALRSTIATTWDIVVCTTYFLGVGICFSFSTIFHTFMSHSESIYLLGMRLDFQGILLWMWGSTIPLVYYSFPCLLTLQISYWLTITVLAGLCSLITCWPQFSGPHWGSYRAALFGSFGIGSFLVPIMHGMIMNGVEEETKRIGLPWILLTLLFNTIAATVYTFKFPEKWFSKTFDLFGASHQLMHVLVLVASLCYTKAVLCAFDFVHEQRMPCDA